MIIFAIIMALKCNNVAIHKKLFVIKVNQTAAEAVAKEQ